MENKVIYEIIDDKKEILRNETKIKCSNCHKEVFIDFKCSNCSNELLPNIPLGARLMIFIKKLLIAFAFFILTMILIAVGLNVQSGGGFVLFFIVPGSGIVTIVSLVQALKPIKKYGLGNYLYVLGKKYSIIPVDYNKSLFYHSAAIIYDEDFYSEKWSFYFDLEEKIKKIKDKVQDANYELFINAKFFAGRGGDSEKEVNYSKGEMQELLRQTSLKSTETALINQFYEEIKNIQVS